MEFNTALAFLTLGIAFVSGTINLLSGLYADGEKTELVFGILVLCSVFFLIVPPFGFIVNDKAPYPLSLDIKRIFIWAHYALLPVFFEYYSGFKRPLIKRAIWLLLAGSYVVMVSTTQDSMKPLWLMIVLAMFGLIAYYGLSVAIRLVKGEEKTKGKWLLASMTIYSVLYVLGLYNQLGNNPFGHVLGSKLFFPFHLNLIAFILLMSIRLRTNTYEKYQLEKILDWRDTRWKSLEENLHFLIVELDAHGAIRYANPFAMDLLGYRPEETIFNKNWFRLFPSDEETNVREQAFSESVTKGKIPPELSSRIYSRLGQELSIHWTSVFVYDKRNEINGTTNIGIDVTQQENAFKQIQALKNELEKENLTLKGLKSTRETDDGIIGNSDTLIYAINKAKQVASTNAGVLLQGETGVGKELFADFIHKYSFRSTRPLVKVNCAALPPDIMESELFGHEKGSFTGAVQSRLGRFELANQGTIFLDEIGELPFSLQSKLLRVLQNGEFERVGGQKTIKVNVRVIAATNRDLQNDTHSGKFREDLFYRLNVFPITIPPLRKRKEDIPLLAASFVKRLSEKHHKSFENLSKADLDRLNNYDWPGNIREMINLLERSIISSTGPTLKLDWLRTDAPAVEREALSSFQSIKDIDRSYIQKILLECNWKINGDDGAASRLGLHPNTLRSRLKKMNITRKGN